MFSYEYWELIFAVHLLQGVTYHQKHEKHSVWRDAINKKTVPREIIYAQCIRIICKWMFMYVITFFSLVVHLSEIIKHFPSVICTECIVFLKIS